MGSLLLPLFPLSIFCLGKTVSCSGGMHTRFFLILDLSPGHVMANVYFTVYRMCVVSELLDRSHDLFFSCNCWVLYLEKSDLVGRWPIQPHG